MESIQEAFLMLNYDNLEGKDQVQPWQLCGLIVHAYNLHRGLKCSGFDEDDPDTGEIINLPSSFHCCNVFSLFEGFNGNIYCITLSILLLDKDLL